MNGVVTARVHLALPDEDPLHAGTARRRPTAAVMLRMRPGTSANESDVRRTIASAVEGLQPADVSVVSAVAAEESQAPELLEVGPLKVARGSRGTALAIGSGALATILLLAVALAAAVIRLGTLRRRMRERDGG
jgi:type III secretion protein J